MHRFLGTLLAAVLVGAVLAGPANAAPADQVVGDGTPGSCTEAAFSAAVAAGGTVTFDCGGPTTIPLTSAKPILQDTTIDGGGVITLTANLTAQLFRVAANVNFSLQNIVLDKGYGHNLGGGAISNNGGVLNLDEANLSFNQTLTDTGLLGFGGAIDDEGVLTVTDSTFNTNQSRYGGAVYVQGLAYLRDW